MIIDRDSFSLSSCKSDDNIIEHISQLHSTFDRNVRNREIDMLVDFRIYRTPKPASEFAFMYSFAFGFANLLSLGKSGEFTKCAEVPRIRNSGIWIQRRACFFGSSSLVLW